MKNKTNTKLHSSPLSLFIHVSFIVGFCLCEQQDPTSNHGGLSSKEDLYFRQHQLLYYRDKFGDRKENVTVDPSLVFENPRLRNAYIALQAWKRAIFSDPSNLTGNWVGSEVCEYYGVFCAPAPDNMKTRTVAGINMNLGNISGYLPEELGLLTGLESVHINSNMLEGSLRPPPDSKIFLLISKNRLAGDIPSSMCNLFYSEKDVVLDLSHNNLSGVIPRCFAFGNVSVLDLQMNHLHGNIPDFCAGGNYMLRTLNLNNNDFDGPLPKSLANCHHLEVLNLGNNKINDTFPHWLGTLPRLQVLVLRSNYFHGELLHSKNGSYFSSLRILDLSHNDFSGFLPRTYFTSLKGMMNLDQVQRGYMGDDIFYYHDSVVVTMKGRDFELQRILTIFATLDMSSNRFQGTIPEIVGNLVSLQVLNFSHNHLTGHISSSFGNMVSLESLDLSCNKLVGEIPSQLADLNFLEWLNLSENHLVGLIPQGKQFNTFLNGSYIGNSGLCGFPVSRGCGHSESPSATSDEQEADSRFKLDWKFVLMGYGCGMVFGFSAGYIMMTIRKPKWLAKKIQRAGNKVVSRFNKYS